MYANDVRYWCCVVVCDIVAMVTASVSSRSHVCVYVAADVSAEESGGTQNGAP